MTGAKSGRTYVIAAGGTGGHILPGLEVAKELRNRGHECVFVGTQRGLEGRLIPRERFPIEFVDTGRWKRVSVRDRLRTLVQMPHSLVEAGAILDRYRPAAVLSLGGYASVPIMVMALEHDIPVAVLEPNAKPGLANRVVGRFADQALVAFDETARYFRSGHTALTGIPIRREFFESPTRTDRSTFTVLITGGSQGSQRINRAAVKAVEIWSKESRLERMRIIHQTGDREYDLTRKAYQSLGVEVELAAFFEDMPRVFSEADLVVCRAGACTLAELSAAGRASILVPYPFAADQHQLRNAEAMKEAGAARLIADADLTGQRLAEGVGALMDSKEELEAMERAAARRAQAGAARCVAEWLEELGAPSGA